MWSSNVMQERGSAFEVRFVVLRNVTMTITVFCDVQPVASGVQVGAIHQPQFWMHILGICKIPKVNMLINPLKNVGQTTASMCCLGKSSWFENDTCSKMSVGKMFCAVLTERTVKLKCRVCRPEKGAFLSLCIHNI